VRGPNQPSDGRVTIALQLTDKHPITALSFPRLTPTSVIDRAAESCSTVDEPLFFPLLKIFLRHGTGFLHVCEHPNPGVLPLLHIARMCIRSIEPLKTANQRFMTAENCGNAFAKTYNLDVVHNSAKITQFESPEKLVVSNPRLSKAAIVNHAIIQQYLALPALRVLLDAFLYKIGYRPMNWTAEDRHQWNPKEAQAGLTRQQAIDSSNTQLKAFGFTDNELLSLFSAEKRLNEAAHRMRVVAVGAALEELDVSVHNFQAIEKAFRYVTGFSIGEVDPHCTAILGARGMEVDVKTDDWFFSTDTPCRGKSTRLPLNIEWGQKKTDGQESLVEEMGGWN
jgi:hypothetical protein